MPRQSREYSESQIYHVILRGIDKQIIFYDDKDRYVFLNQILITLEKYKYEIYAYCLMSNHIHLVLRIKDEFLSKAIQSLEIRYSKYFNEKYERSGHFFENRFKSKVVNDEKYFLDVCRYVHRNPEKAKISSTESYKWSSYHEYIHREKIINKEVLLNYYENQIEQFTRYTLDVNRIKDDENYAEFEILDKIDDKELIGIILRILEFDSIEEISKLNITLQKELINKIKNIKGTNINQISRVTKVSRGIIKRLYI